MGGFLCLLVDQHAVRRAEKLRKQIAKLLAGRFLGCRRAGGASSRAGRAAGRSARAGGLQTVTARLAGTVPSAMMVVMVMCPLGLPGDLLFEGSRVDAVVFQDLVPGSLQDRSEVRGVAGLFGILDGVVEGRCELIPQTGRARARRGSGGRRGGRGRRAGSTGGAAGA